MESSLLYFSIMNGKNWKFWPTGSMNFDLSEEQQTF